MTNEQMNEVKEMAAKLAETLRTHFIANYKADFTYDSLGTLINQLEKLAGTEREPDEATVMRDHIKKYHSNSSCPVCNRPNPTLLTLYPSEEKGMNAQKACIDCVMDFRQGLIKGKP